MGDILSKSNPNSSSSSSPPPPPTTTTMSSPNPPQTHSSTTQTDPTHKPESLDSSDPPPVDTTKNSPQSDVVRKSEVEKVLAEAEQDEDECGFCLYMKGGGCKDEFVNWEKCVADAEKNEEDIVEKCFEVTRALKDCMFAHPEYYSPILQAEELAAAEAAKAAKELEKEKEREREENKEEKRQEEGEQRESVATIEVERGENLAGRQKEAS